jgi:hypothetical protein
MRRLLPLFVLAPLAALAAKPESKYGGVQVGTISYDKKGDITAIDWAIFKWDNKGNYDELVADSRT